MQLQTLASILKFKLQAQARAELGPVQPKLVQCLYSCKKNTLSSLSFIFSAENKCNDSFLGLIMPYGLALF